MAVWPGENKTPTRSAVHTNYPSAGAVWDGRSSCGGGRRLGLYSSPQADGWLAAGTGDKGIHSTRAVFVQYF